MTYLEGVYWDLDGTIANTELEAHLPAFNYAFNDFDLEWYWDKSTYIEPVSYTHLTLPTIYSV